MAMFALAVESLWLIQGMAPPPPPPSPTIGSILDDPLFSVLCSNLASIHDPSNRLNAMHASNVHTHSLRAPISPSCSGSHYNHGTGQGNSMVSQHSAASSPSSWSKLFLCLCLLYCRMASSPRRRSSSTRTSSWAVRPQILESTWSAMMNFDC